MSVLDRPRLTSVLPTPPLVGVIAALLLAAAPLAPKIALWVIGSFVLASGHVFS